MCLSFRAEEVFNSSLRDTREMSESQLLFATCAMNLKV